MLNVITFDTGAKIGAARQMSDKTKQRKVLGSRGLGLCRMMSAFVWGFDPIFWWWRGVFVVIFAWVGMWVPTNVSQNCNLPWKNLYHSVSKSTLCSPCITLQKCTCTVQQQNHHHHKNMCFRWSCWNLCKLIKCGWFGGCFILCAFVSMTVIIYFGYEENRC